MDVIGFARALVANARAGRVVQGGSTITQQLAKNLWLTPERSIIRKLKELMLAIWLEARLEKREILTLYLNRVYLGAGSFGVEAASQRYFGKSARRVTLGEAALLAGLLKAPSRYAPTNDLPRAHRRAAEVIDNMVEAGYLKEKQAAATKRAPARLSKSAGSSGRGKRLFRRLDRDTNTAFRRPRRRGHHRGDHSRSGRTRFRGECSCADLETPR